MSVTPAGTGGAVVAGVRPDDAAVPVVEVFGGTVQGEGPLAGVPTHFIRIAGCDYRCGWCDSPHAVLPKLWKGTPRIRSAEIVERVQALPAGPRWVTISGGNPAMYHLDALTKALHALGYRVAVETQGSTWKPWLTDVDMLVLSPKPPSSGMVNKTAKDFGGFVNSCVRTARQGTGTAVKIVVFTSDDYEWAMGVFERIARPGWAKCLSLGTPVRGGLLEHLTESRPERSHAEAVTEMANGYQLLCEKAAADPRAHDVRCLPQMHVLAFGDRVGV